MTENRIFRPFIEINISEHCNLTCDHCDHYSPYLKNKFADIDQTCEDLAVLSQVLHANHLLLLGGEPLLHPKFKEFCDKAKKTGIANQLVLVTNGLLLHKMDEHAWSLLDGIRISHYPGTKFSLSQEKLDQLSKKHNVWVWRSDVSTFDITESDSEITDQQMRETIFTNCFMGQICNTVRDGRYYRCPPSVFIEERLKLRGVDFKNKDQDSVQIRNNINLLGELNALLSQSEPLEACKFCLGSLGKKVPHTIMNKKVLNKKGTQKLKDSFSYKQIRNDFTFKN